MTEKIDPSRFKRRDYQAEAVRPRVHRPQPVVMHVQPPVAVPKPIAAPAQAQPRTAHPPHPAVVARPAQPPQQPYLTEPVEQPKPVQKLKSRKKSKKKFWPAIVAILLVLVLAGGAYVYIEYKSSSTAPKAISQSVKFPLYYPDLANLPKGYSFNSSSFETPVKDGVLLTMKFNTNEKVVFSMQAAPSETAMRAFLLKYLPSPVERMTPVGTALVGAHNGKTLVSLQTKDATWLVVTAPGDINKAELNQILDSVKKQDPKKARSLSLFSNK